MWKQARLIAISFLLVTGLVANACQSQKYIQKEQAFNEMFASVSMDKELELREPEKVIGNIPPHSKLVRLINHSDYAIEIPKGPSARLFAYSEDSGWVELSNYANVHRSWKFLPEDKERPMINMIDTLVIPDLQELDDYKEIRVVITGTIYLDDDTPGSQVGAFLDVVAEDFIR
ncbi:MAG: hypothetical protein AB1894_27125 [Chloroflexota bacterium]